MIEGLSHITIIVKNLERTSTLLCEGLGAVEIYDSKDKNYSISKEKFFSIAGIWLVAMEGEVSEKSYRHIAFKVQKEDLVELEQRLKDLSVQLVPSRPRVKGEGNSIYFYDYDNNLFELHAGSLKERLINYKP
jgi:catechol 2,3-dioxygenase-like lactoylglutathione lyase family enzyme